MTSEQRDFLRKQIDAQMRERLGRARSAKEQARTEALERHRHEEAVASADRACLLDDAGQPGAGTRLRRLQVAPFYSPGTDEKDADGHRCDDDSDQVRSVAQRTRADKPER